MRVARQTSDGLPSMLPSRPMRRAPRQTGRSARAILKRRAVAALQKAHPPFTWDEIAEVMGCHRNQVAKYARQNRQLRDEVLKYVG